MACFQIHLIFLKVNSHAWLRDMCMQLCFCLLMSLKALIGNWGICLLLKAIFFLMPIGWGLRQNFITNNIDSHSSFCLHLKK